MAAITSPGDLREPRLAHFLFNDGRFAPALWLVLRVWVGWQWLEAGLHKVNDAAGLWVGAKSGVALTGFAQGAIAKASGDYPAVQGWYADFLEQFVIPNAPFMSHVIAYGETAVGLGLILGALTGIAAFFGVVMNANFLLAGTVSVNPIMAIPSIFLILAWRNAGWFGADRWLLPLVGTPWQPGEIERPHPDTPAS
jgi:thiosulfate dehydrogenase [quinone] large subunit